jgi:hypothetical protein
MNYASVNFLSNSLDGVQRSLLARQMRQREDEQRQLENRLKEEMMALQRRDADARIANAEREFGYRRERDQVGDQRYTDETGYRRGRDTLGDQRYTDETQYRRGRDTVGDQRYNEETARRAQQQFEDNEMKRMELALRAQANQMRGNVGDYVTEELDEEGNVIGTRRRRAVPMGGQTPPARRSAAPRGPASPAELIEAVKSGRMDKQQAKEYAKQQGWE